MAMSRAGEESRPLLSTWTRRLEEAPWWLGILLLAGILITYSVLGPGTYRETLLFLIPAIGMTMVLALVSFSLALVLGLIAGLGRVSGNPIIYTIASLYVEVVRGVPILVQILYVAFVITPGIVGLFNLVGQVLTQMGPLAGLGFSLAALSIRDVEMPARGIIALAVAYGAYEAEVFRAGIEAISKGQMEAARSLGMSYFQAMRTIILPQAIRVILPPIGNDFISMVKDTSLVSALAVRELTQLGKLLRGRTFRTFETWNMVAFLYLTMTISLSLLVRFLERRMSVE
jgi:polar amino acid transport system permease protein